MNIDVAGTGALNLDYPPSRQEASKKTWNEQRDEARGMSDEMTLCF